MRTNIDAILEAVQWEPVVRNETQVDELPYATHSGVLEIAGLRMRCYRLNTGMAVFDADDVRDFLDGALGVSRRGI